MDIEQAVAQHYAHGTLEQAILAALAAAGKEIERLSIKDLAPVDEFHIGGRPATVAFAEQFAPAAGAQLIDIGCGLGGAARYFAAEKGCTVTGIDLSEEYAAVANLLAAKVGLGERVRCRQASALALPFAAASFDGAYMLHVGMNIEDKARLFREVRRVLKPGGRFGIYDAMRLEAGDLSYPLPWASQAAASFVVDAAGYRSALAQAGFDVVHERNQREFALKTFEQMRAKAAGGAPAPLGLHLVMGADSAAKMRNMVAGVTKGLIAPTELICRAI